MYDSRTVANEFLKLADKDNDTLTPMQLLKLVFIAHGWCLGLLGRHLIKDSIEAWQYGPVIPKGVIEHTTALGLSAARSR